MNILSITITIFLALSILLTIGCGYMLCRNDRVHQFQIWLIKQSSEAGASYLRMGQYDKYLLVDSLTDKHSYERMLYSFKPLKLKYWFTEEEISLLYPPFYVIGF